MIVDLLITLVKILFILAITVGFFAPVLTWVERKQSAVMQDRIGANRADILGFTALGLFHAVADALKMFTKEDFIPQGANKVLHTLSPVLALVPAIVTFSVVPFGGEYTLFGKKVSLVISDLNVGLLFVFAIASLSTYGYVIAGWSSNNNWSLLGSMRTSSQMISYEVTMGLTIIGVLMVYGTMKLTEIGAAQENFFHWGIFLQPLGFFMFLAASIAENKRIPFDNPEAES
ncbi:MAG: NADH-quinone oxidoreductase subunit H, partial [Nitrospinae bacterium]|nr:NADH-quinone oxidoreductase subunit H [Nitrospinota bacterium]